MAEKLSNEFMSPLWLMEFDANYPINGTNTFNKDLKILLVIKAVLAKELNEKTELLTFLHMPNKKNFQIGK